MISMRRSSVGLALAFALVGFGGCTKRPSGTEGPSRTGASEASQREGSDERATAGEPSGPAYDENADADAALERARVVAKKDGRPILVIFGANWCPDCRALDAAMKSRANAPMLAKEFVIVKVDVGNWDKNLDLDARYGHPIKGGIPAAVVISPDDQVIYATRAGELADARKMSESGVHDFFAKVAKGGADAR